MIFLQIYFGIILSIVTVVLLVALIAKHVLHDELKHDVAHDDELSWLSDAVTLDQDLRSKVADSLRQAMVAGDWLTIVEIKDRVIELMAEKGAACSA